MLLEFRVSNFRSFAEEQILSLVPSPKQKEFASNIIEREKYQLLNAIAFYGANASGKSNLINAMSFLDKMISLSARTSSTTKLPYEPFLLQEGWTKKPTHFEITFVLGQNRYRYGIQYFESSIESEWLYRKNVGREVSLFQRQGDEIEVGKGFEGSTKKMDAAIEITRTNSLFLSTCDMMNVEEAKGIFKWFNEFHIIDGLNTEAREIQTVELWKMDTYQTRIKEFIVSLNLGIKNLSVLTEPFETSQLPEYLSDKERKKLGNQLKDSTRYQVSTTHEKFDEAGNVVGSFDFQLDEHESAGTQKSFHLSGPIVWVIENGGVLVVDEIEAKMHPIMTLFIIQYFLNPETNPRKAQLIFGTHDTNLLTYAHLRRDQIYFVEKNKTSASEIYSLSDFIYQSSVNGSSEKRPDADKEKRYLEGRYGAIPSLSFSL